MTRSWEVVRQTSAPIETVWSVLVDARKWNQWGRFKVARLEQVGAPLDDGVGAIRNFGNPPILSREEVIVFDVPHHFAYKMLSGLPITGYRADVYLTSDQHGNGTTIRWCSQFDTARPAFTSRFFEGFLKRFIADTAKRLAIAAEKQG